MENGLEASCTKQNDSLRYKDIFYSWKEGVRNVWALIIDMGVLIDKDPPVHWHKSNWRY